MCETADQPTRCPRIERDGEIGCNPHRIMELLNDDDARAVYLFVEEPATVRDISEALDIPQSTTYRKVESLTEAGLISQLNDRSRTGTPGHYVQAMDRVSVTYDDPLRIECTCNGNVLYCEP
ncbi:helix-turn-helix domain-containing protein [Natrinema longum]|uniref:Helix-turn-helix domain-containing protein n=1 Tax=Natrinema longum TaxID=370324 RepID=A0A8A2U795_9EURY|nr:helix-turn-helix domain-containing protein [Natrinema longum]MBZ6494893.1 helix-turn-helix domain-containing protein [Natrinema longum]QSW83808.1 helix-turn-helix domain-containing protein [Natrinema longum]